MFWIALAAQLSLPVALEDGSHEPHPLFSADDMPAYVQIEGINRFVSTRTTIRPDGTPQDCTVQRGSGDAKLDAYTCALILKRAKVQPAKWLDGSPAYAVVRMPVAWTVGGPASKSESERAFPADMEISVSRLPASADGPTDLRLMIAVDENGRVIGCEAESPASKWDRTKSVPALLAIACNQMMSQFTAIPAKDASGKPVRSVQTASVVFSTGAQPNR
jgi:hypothetical protein